MTQRSKMTLEQRGENQFTFLMKSITEWLGLKHLSAHPFFASLSLLLLTIARDDYVDFILKRLDELGLCKINNGKGE